MKIREVVEKNPIIMIFLGVLGISLSSIFVKFSSAPSSVTAAYRLLWTVLLMTPSVIFKQEIRSEMKGITRKDLILGCCSGLFLALHFLFWFESLQHTSVASSTTIVCTEVIWVSIGYCLFLGGKISFKAGAVITVAFLGSIMIAMGDNGAGATHLYGDFLALIAAVTVAIYVLIGRILRQRLSTTVYTYLVYVSCCVVLVVITLIQGVSLVGHGIAAVVVVGLLLAVFSTILGHSIFSWCLKYFSPSFVSASKLCEPVGAGILALILFQEVPGGMQLAGCGLIIVSVFLYSRMEVR